jgi:hypothetical protein
MKQALRTIALGLAVGGLIASLGWAQGSTGTLPSRQPCADTNTYVYLPLLAGTEIQVCNESYGGTLIFVGRPGTVDPYGPIAETELPGGVLISTPRLKGESQSMTWWRHSVAIAQSTALVLPFAGSNKGPPSFVQPASTELETEWYSGGILHRVRTKPTPTETPEEAWDRHDTWVKAGKQKYPPDEVLR